MDVVVMNLARAGGAASRVLVPGLDAKGGFSTTGFDWAIDGSLICMFGIVISSL
jgi:hypothetical protein